MPDIFGCTCLYACVLAATRACSYEHSIANMFVIPLAMRLGAPISLHTFLVKNLIPVTLGNIVGGAIFVCMAMSLSLRLPRETHQRCRRPRLQPRRGTQVRPRRVWRSQREPCRCWNGRRLQQPQRERQCCCAGCDRVIFGCAPSCVSGTERGRDIRVSVVFLH